MQRALEHIEDLSPEEQQDLAEHIEDLTTPLEGLPELDSLPADVQLPPSVRAALAWGGAWSDLRDDDELTLV